MENSHTKYTPSTLAKHCHLCRSTWHTHSFCRRGKYSDRQET